MTNTKTRIYKFALRPTPTQRKVLDKVGSTSRFLWNRLVREQRFALRELELGRRATLERRYAEIFAQKQLVGMRTVAVRKIAETKLISEEEALKVFVEESVAKDTRIVVNKKGKKALRWSARHLSWRWAQEKVNSERGKLISPSMAAVWTGLMAKWTDFGKAWDDPKRFVGAPRPKKAGVISAIQKQVTNCTIDKTVDLSWCGSKVLSDVEVNRHRELPADSKIVQLALVRNSLKEWFLCVFVTAPGREFQREFLKTDETVGIDPGIKTALTLSNGVKILPKGLSKDKRVERKLVRLQRKLSRQTRVNNLHCFNSDGTWKKRVRVTNRTKGMMKSVIASAEIKRRYKDRREDYYHNQAIAILNSFDVIGVGNYRPHKNTKMGKGKVKRKINRIVRDHAISDFVSKLQDKAKLSLTPKAVYPSMSEKNTSNTCHVCGKKKTNLRLKDREWVCSGCNTKLDRDVNAAINIKAKTISEMEAAVAQSVSGGQPLKVRRPGNAGKRSS